MSERVFERADAASLRELACELATLGGTMAADGWRRDIASGTSRSTMTASTKSSRTDVVTLHDRAAEATIVAALAARRPDDAIVGEEGTQRPGTSGLSWYLDPIDGTTNFLYGLPAVVDVGRSRRRRRSAAPAPCSSPSPVSCSPRPAARGRPATATPIRSSSEIDVSLALVATGFGYLPSRRAEQAAPTRDADRARPRHPARRIGGPRSLLRRGRNGRRLLRGRAEQLGRRRRRADRPRGRLPHRRLRRRTSDRPPSYSSHHRQLFEQLSALLRSAV